MLLFLCGGRSAEGPKPRSPSYRIFLTGPCSNRVRPFCRPSTNSFRFSRHFSVAVRGNYTSVTDGASVFGALKDFGVMVKLVSVIVSGPVPTRQQVGALFDQLRLSAVPFRREARATLSPFSRAKVYKSGWIHLESIAPLCCFLFA